MTTNSVEGSIISHGKAIEIGKKVTVRQGNKKNLKNISHLKTNSFFAENSQCRKQATIN